MLELFCCWENGHLFNSISRQIFARSKEGPMTCCGNLHGVRTVPAKTHAGVFLDLSTMMASPFPLRSSMWRWHAGVESPKSRISMSIGRYCQCEIGSPTFLRATLAFAWGAIPLMRTGQKCTKVSGLDGRNMSPAITYFQAGNHWATACHSLRMATRAKQLGKHHFWWKVFGVQLAGKGWTILQCLGFLSLVSATKFWSLDFMNFECWVIYPGTWYLLIMATGLVQLRSSFCSRFLFTCMSSACFAGDLTLRQLNTHWVEQMLELFENGLEAGLLINPHGVPVLVEAIHKPYSVTSLITWSSSLSCSCPSPLIGHWSECTLQNLPRMAGHERWLEVFTFSNLACPEHSFDRDIAALSPKSWVPYGSPRILLIPHAARRGILLEHPLEIETRLPPLQREGLVQ